MNSEIGHNLSPEEMNRLFRWYYMVIRQLATTPEFKEDPVWIHTRLRGKVPVVLARQALTDLIEFGILRRSTLNGRLEQSDSHVESSHDVSNFAIRVHHREMMERATEALVEQPLLSRHMNSLTVRLDPKRISEAKD